MTPSESEEREAPDHARLEVHPQAPADIEAAYGWYERQRPELEKNFVRAVDAALSAVRNRPGMCARVHGETRRATVPGAVRPSTG